MQLVGPIVGGLVALCAVAYGKHLERSQWLRDRRLEAYADFIGGVDTLLASLEGTLRSPPPDPLTTLATIAGRITLLGPPRMVAEVEAILTLTIRNNDLLAGSRRGEVIHILTSARTAFVREASNTIRAGIRRRLL